MRTAVHATPTDRLDRVELGTQREALDHVVEVSAYACPHCTATVEFLSRHFELRPPVTRLAPEWAERFDALRPLDATAWESFLDFHCPGCSAPVRLVYAAGECWGMASYSWRVVDILEAGAWPSGT